ncbi:MAG TPA: alpha/beta hydrolase [Nevskiaceae bacterium]
MAHRRGGEVATVELHAIDTQGPDDNAAAEASCTGGLCPPVVLIHGIGASSRDWDYVLPVLRAGRRLIAPDLRGHGASPVGRGYGLQAMAEDVWALLDRLHVERFDLVGHSLGGAVALQMAVDRPQRLRRAVFANTLPDLAIDTSRKAMLYWFRMAVMAALGPRGLTEVLARLTAPTAHDATLRARFIAHGSGSRSRFVYLRALWAMRRWRVTERLGRIACPSLVLAAEHDYFARDDAERFAAGLPRARLEIVPGVHHLMPLEVPEAFARRVSDFLDAASP